jgi:hypothetical protein
VDQIEGGEEPAVVASKFTEIAKTVTQNQGYLVSHNIEFGLDALKSIGVVINQFPQRFCTNPVSTTDICKLPGGRPYKWPTQEQLHNFLFPNNDILQTHDAGDDVNMLRQNFFECVARAKDKKKGYNRFLFH